MTNWEKELKLGKNYKLMWNELFDRVNDQTKESMKNFERNYMLKYGYKNNKDMYMYIWENVKHIQDFIAANYDPRFIGYLHIIEENETKRQISSMYGKQASEEARSYLELNEAIRKLRKTEAKYNACLIKFSIAFADYISIYKEQFNDATVPPHEVWGRIQADCIKRNDSGTANVMSRIVSQTDNKEIPEDENKKFKGYLMKLLNVLPKLKWDACNYDNNNCNFMDIWFFIREAECIQKYKMLLNCIEGRYEAYSNVSYYRQEGVESTPVCVKSNVIEDFSLILNMIDHGHTGVAKRRIQMYLYAFAYAKSLYKVFEEIGLYKDNVESLVYDLSRELYEFYINEKQDIQVIKLPMNGSIYELRVKMKLGEDVIVSLSKSKFDKVILSMHFAVRVSSKERILPFSEIENTLSKWIGEDDVKKIMEEIDRIPDTKGICRSFTGFVNTDEETDKHVTIRMHVPVGGRTTTLFVNEHHLKLYKTDTMRFKKSVMYIFKNESEDKDMIIGKYTGFPIIPKPEKKDQLVMKAGPLTKEKEDAWRKINLYWECVVARITYLVQYREMKASDATNLIIHLGKFKVTNVYEGLTIDDKWKKDNNFQLDEKTKDIIYQYIMLCTDVVLKDKFHK